MALLQYLWMIPTAAVSQHVFAQDQMKAEQREIEKMTAAVKEQERQERERLEHERQERRRHEERQQQQQQQQQRPPRDELSRVQQELCEKPPQTARFLFSFFVVCPFFVCFLRRFCRHSSRLL